MEGADGKGVKVPELNFVHGGKIKHLLLTDDYFIISCGNSDGTVTVYRISRESGESAECCTIADSNDVTVSDDGWIYYAQQAEDGSRIYSMKLDTLERSDKVMYLSSQEHVFYQPIAAGDYLYSCIYNKFDDSDYSIIRIDRNTGYKEEDPIWYIGSQLEGYTNRKGLAYNVNLANQDIFFCIGARDSDVPSDLYQLKMHDDGTFDICLKEENAWCPNILYLGNGDYEVYFYSTTDKDGTVSSVYSSNYYTFDADGNLVKRTQ